MHFISGYLLFYNYKEEMFINMNQKLKAGLSMYLKIYREIQVWLKSDKNNGYFAWRRVYIYDYLAEFFLEWNTLRQIWRENQNTHFVFNTLFSENCTVYKIMWKNMVEPEKPQMTL